jgi:uncharacterized protein with von Willebrand factor type A (vWA) domain
MLRQLSLFLGGSVLAVAGLAGAQSSGDYAEDLARLYAGHQRVLALRQACEESYPGQRGIYDKAYDEWNTRHHALLQDLEQRLTGMLRRASKDQQEYSRNLGKYEGAILQQRLEYKQTLLAQDKADLEQQCRQLPDYLASPDADFRKKYAQELQTLGKRKP